MPFDLSCRTHEVRMLYSVMAICLLISSSCFAAEIFSTSQLDSVTWNAHRKNTLKGKNLRGTIAVEADNKYALVKADDAKHSCQITVIGMLQPFGNGKVDRDKVVYDLGRAVAVSAAITGKELKRSQLIANTGHAYFPLNTVEFEKWLDGPYEVKLDASPGRRPLPPFKTDFKDYGWRSNDKNLWFEEVKSEASLRTLLHLFADPNDPKKLGKVTVSLWRLSISDDKLILEPNIQWQCDGPFEVISEENVARQEK